MIKSIAIDDEPMALEVIKAHARKVDFIDLKETFVSALEAIKYLNENAIDLVFLDINMPDITGLELSQMLPDNMAFVFTTAYSNYAVDAFKLNALDYLMKPIDFGRFSQACQKAKITLQKEDAEANFIFVKDGYDWVRVSLEDLLFVKSEGNYLTFNEINKKTLTRMTLTEAVELLPKKFFFRIHKSFLVNLNHVQKIERHQLSVTNGELVPIAANYHADFMEALKQLWTVK
jgi:two-component system, LytTR family, response regulator